MAHSVKQRSVTLQKDRRNVVQRFTEEGSLNLQCSPGVPAHILAQISETNAEYIRLVSKNGKTKSKCEIKLQSLQLVAYSTTYI